MANRNRNPFARDSDAGVEIYPRRVIVLETPGGHPVHFRPVEVVFGDDSCEKLLEVLDDNGVIDITHSEIQEIAREIVRPTAVSHGEVLIENAWDINRCAIFAEFVIETPNATRSVALVMYTDFAGIDRSGRLDETMMLSINSYSVISHVESVNSGGRAVRYMPKSAEHILRPMHVANRRGDVDVLSTALRPEDVFTYIQESQSDTKSEYDSRRKLTDDGLSKATSRENSTSSHYMSKIIRGFKASADENDVVYGNHSKNMFVYGSARSKISSSRPQANALFQLLSQRTEIGSDGRIQWNEMLDIWPELERMPEVIRLDRAAIRDVEDYSEWGGDDDKTIISVALSHVIPATMERLSLTNIGLTFTNDTVDGSLSVIWHSCATMFDTLDDVERKERFEDILEMAILKEIIPEHIAVYEVTVDSSIVGTTVIDISLNDSEFKLYELKNYCDHLATSQIVESHESAMESAMNMNEILNKVTRR